jgi:REP element-mobilizing transposase RayT
MEFLASIFGIDCLTYTVMQNHLHVVLRSRADVVASWSDQEVAGRWLRLFPCRRNKDGSPAEPRQPEIDLIVNQPKLLADRRERLSDVSWWMRCLAENIARLANKEDECTGRFWEGRFKCQLLLDEASLLACAAYVDLNPVRAAIAETPETSDYTGAKDRLDDLKQCPDRSRLSTHDRSRLSTHDWERSRQRQRSGWLSPVEIDERSDAAGPDLDASGRRASRKGFLSFSLLSYVELLDWTGRQLRSDKQGKIPDHLQPILTRIGLDAPAWCDLVVRFGKVFKRAAGAAESLAAEAERRGQGWMQSPGNPLVAA